MKTTIDLPTELVLKAKRTALDRRTTLRALVLKGLQREIGLLPEETPHGFHAILDVGKGDWHGVDADRHVENERSGWK